ncbi:hypothetical protein FA95DRAFT_1558368 [Auriscalpium vulgare]|uniref:Uncharacterized protein n=1 Tax=Auriscalpium vulgare TaxID=40419 RepID=A0ACB8RX48_9AGAM|nr:hypothetical protein FA95DRAFT_1558368 [Auriscalpium vulgare]
MQSSVSSHIETSWPPRPCKDGVEKPRLFTHWRPSLGDRPLAPSRVIERPAGSSSPYSVSAGSEISSSAAQRSTSTASSSTAPFAAYTVHDQSLFGGPAQDDIISFTEHAIRRRAGRAHEQTSSNIWGDAYTSDVRGATALLLAKQPVLYSACRLSRVPVGRDVTYFAE